MILPTLSDPTEMFVDSLLEAKEEAFLVESLLLKPDMLPSLEVELGIFFAREVN